MKHLQLLAIAFAPFLSIIIVLPSLQWLVIAFERYLLKHQEMAWKIWMQRKNKEAKIEDRCLKNMKN